MLFYCFPRSSSLLSLNVRLQTAAGTKSTLPSSEMWGHLENTVYLLAMYFNLAAVKNMGGIENVYWWKVTYSIFYITHGQTPCLQWSVVYRQSGWQWPELHKGSKPTATASLLPVSLHRAANSSKDAHQCSCGACAQLVGLLLLRGCLAHPCVGVLSNFLHVVLSVMLHLWKFLSSPAVVQLREIRTTRAEDWFPYRLCKFGFSQSPLVTSSRWHQNKENCCTALSLRKTSRVSYHIHPLLKI